MHEAGLVRDVLEHAGRVIRGHRGRLSSISLRVGAASGIEPDAIRRHAEVVAVELWGYRPRIEVGVEDDPLDPGLHGLYLASVRVEEA